MKGKGIKMVSNGFGAERFVVSLIALTPFGSYNRRICGFAFGYAQISQGETSHIPGSLSEIAGNVSRKVI